jgi:uncharacterized LabA/DUF88 family protein
VATERSHRRHIPSSGPVALFVDWDNFAIGLRQEMPERPPDLGPILRWARRAGTLIVSRAYGEWRDATERLAIYNAGVDAVYAPVLPLGGSLAAYSGAGGAKSLADTAMAVDVAEFLTLIPSVQTLILATSDKDLIPVIRFAQKRGVYSGVVGSDRTAAALRELADEFVTYRQLLEDEAPQPIAVSRPVTVPPLRSARPLRRFGDPISEPLAPIMREPRSLGSTPTYTRHEPIVTPSTGSGLDIQAPSHDAEGARRRRRGGRRRRGAETLALGDGPTVANDDASTETVEPVAESAAPAQPVIASPAAVSTRPAIVLPMIAPRAPRPSAERFASLLTTSPELTATQPAQLNEVTPSVETVGATVELSVAPVAHAPDALDVQPVRAVVPSSPSEAGDAPPTRRPRVQLPGEKLRRLIPDSEPASSDPVVADTSVANVLSTVSEAMSLASPPEVETALVETDPDGAPSEPQAPVAGLESAHVDETETQMASPDVPEVSEELQDAGGTPDGLASPARRRRGGRTPTPIAGSSATTGSTPPPSVDGPIASPNDPDAASAPESAADSNRGRRRGGRAQVTA